MDVVQLPTILEALLLAAVLWVVKTTNDTQRDVAVLRALTQTTKGDMDQLRSDNRELRTAVHGVLAHVGLLEQRLEAVEARLPDQRRRAGDSSQERDG